MPSTDAAPAVTGSTPTQAEYWTDEKLLAKGWTQQQVDIWKAEQAEGGAAASSGDEVPEMEMSSAEASGLPGNHPAAKYKFSNSVLEGVMEKFGITDKDSFMRHAVLFDSDGNNYLSGKELESAAEHFTSQ